MRGRRCSNPAVSTPLTSIEYEVGSTLATLQGGQQDELRAHQIERCLAVPGDEKFPLTGV